MEYGLVIVWLALYLGLGALAVPASSLVLGALPDRGAGLAIPLAFAVLAFVGFWVGQVTFGPLTAVLTVAVLGATALLARRRGVEVHWQRYGDAAFVFALTFGLLVLVRAADPAAYPGGGEKFLDFGMLASLLRGSTLPPQDVWFANEPVQYYYGGHMLAALFAHLTDTGPEYAYNLALAGYYAAYTTAAFGLAGAISAGVGRSYRRGGAVAAFLVAIASNLSTPTRLLVWLLPDGLATRLASLANLEVEGLATGPFAFDYWLASRVMDAGPAGDWHHITEFPFFAFLNGDLHGHMMSPPLLLLGAAVAYAYWRTPRVRIGRRLALTFLTLPPLVGLLLVVNTWSAPALVGVAWLSLLFAPAPPWSLLPDGVGATVERWTGNSRLSEEISRVVLATLFAVVVAALGALSVWPFLVGSASGRAIGLFPEGPSRLAGLLLVQGAFLAITAGFLLRERGRSELIIAVLIWAGVVGLASTLGYAAVGLFVPPLLAGWYALRTDGAVDFETVLAVGALGLLVLVEFVYVVEQAGPGRMNTVFKIYAQIWALWSVAAGAMVASAPPIVETLQESSARIRGVLERGGGDARSTTGSVGGRQTAVAVLLAVLLVSTSIYAGFATGARVGGHNGEWTLDARAYVDDRHPKEAAAIEWLDGRSGQPTIVSAPGQDIYQWVNAPSSLTGIPTVAGWSHEVGYRGAEAYNSRVRDVNVIFETDEARSRAVLLDRYDVEYVYVGPIERDRYDVGDYGAEPGVSVAYEDEWVTIYRVNETELIR